MHTTSRRAVVAAAIATLVLAACGPGGPATPGSTAGPGATAPPGSSGAVATTGPGSGETVDACALLTAADVQDVTGLEIGSSASGPQFGIFPDGCQWELVDEEAIVPPAISFGVMSSGGRDYYDRYFAPFNEEYGYTAIDGLGDEAVDAEAGSVLVVAGDVFLNLQFLGLTGDDTRIATELAKKVVANLPR